MLLQIDVYPNGVGSSGSQKPSQTLYANPATRGGKGSDNDIGLIATIGRKSDMDIAFGREKSMSRKHAVLRFVAPKIDDDDDGEYFVEPRNKQESAACENSPYRMCVVLESTGKSGSFIASRDDDATPKIEPKKNAGVESDDETTDDEGNTQPTQSYATSMATQTGEMINNAEISISNAIRNHFGDVPVKLLKVDANENQILQLGGTVEKAEGDNDGNNSHEDVNKNTTSIIIQFGNPSPQSTLPTIKITQIPMVVVMSSSVSFAIERTLRYCGGRVQNDLLPRFGETTQLIVPERMPVAKQIIAWCYRIPCISQDFIVALNSHESIHEPFPDCSMYPALVGNDTKGSGFFWDEIHDENLLSNYIILSADESSEFESEGLAEAGGARVERLYDTGKKPTKAKVTAFTKIAQSLLSETKDTEMTVLLLASRVNAKTKTPNTNTNMLIKKLKDLEMETTSVKVLAKAITHKNSDLLGLKNDTGKRKNNPNPVPESGLEAKNKMKRNAETRDRNLGDKNKDNTNQDSGPDLVTDQTPSVPHDNRSNRNKRKISSPPYDDESQRTLGEADSNGWFAAAPKNDHERVKWRSFASEAYRKKTGDGIEQPASTSGVIKVLGTSLTTAQASLPSGCHASRGRQSRQIGHRSQVQVRCDVPNFKKFKKNKFKQVHPNDRVVLLQVTSHTRENFGEMSAEQKEIEEDQRLADALFRGDPVATQKKRRRHA